MLRSRSKQITRAVVLCAPRRILLGVVLATALLVPRSGAAQGAVDQSSECVSQIFQIQFYSPIGQTFVPASARLSAIEVQLFIMNPPQNDTITMRLHEGAIDGPVLASGSQSFVYPPSPVWAHYDLGGIVNVVPGATYVIELAATNPSWMGASLTTDTCPDYAPGVAIQRQVGGISARDWSFRTYSPCGDGNLDAGEQCDAGAANGKPGSCCSSACEIMDAGTQCRASAGACDVADVCDGSSTDCPDVRAIAGTQCRASTGECDVADTCDGTSVGCADNFAPAGTTCTDDGTICTSDQCNGTGACTHLPGNAGAVCRAATDACDIAETCDGLVSTCPADVHQPDSDGDGECDVIDACTSTGAQDFSFNPIPNLLLGKINTDTQPGNDKLNLSGAFTLPASAPFSSLALDVTGARVVVENADGTHLVDVVVPPGAYSAATKSGWKRSGSGKAWTFTDSATPTDGIKKLTVVDRSGAFTPRLVLTKVVGANGSYPVVASDQPLQAIVTLGDQAAAAAGVCGESAFIGPDCKLNKSGDQIRCTR